MELACTKPEAESSARGSSEVAEEVLIAAEDRPQRSSNLGVVARDVYVCAPPRRDMG